MEFQNNEIHLVIDMEDIDDEMNCKEHKEKYHIKVFKSITLCTVCQPYNRCFWNLKMINEPRGAQRS